MLDLPITKFMDWENTNWEKVYVSYIDIVVSPLFTAYLIISDPETKKQILEDGIEKNWKHLENWIDTDNSK